MPSKLLWLLLIGLLRATFVFGHDSEPLETHQEGPDTLVLCPVDFQPALGRWLDYRRSQGHRVTVVSPAPIAAGIRKQILDVADGGTLKNVVLVGDSGDERVSDDRLVATDFVSARVNVKFGSEPEIPTDNTYADLDRDGLPDLAIGRIPVDSARELSQFGDRVIEYEKQSNRTLDESLWRRRINFVAGVGGLGSVVDTVIEQTTKQILADLVPKTYRTSMTYGSWASPYCPDPRRFCETTIRRFNEGCLFWVYVGHGDRQQLDWIHLPDQSHPVLDTSSARFLSCHHGSPIAIFLACYTGVTDDHDDGLAETMLRQPRGPIAVLCGTRVTMPYAMSLLSLEMTRECFEGDSQTLGELTRRAKRQMVQGEAAESHFRKLIESMGRALGPIPELLFEERMEHVQLIHLIGDPLLRIKRPEKLTLEVDAQANAGSELIVKGISPVEGELLLELTYERDRFLVRPKRRRQYVSSDAAFGEYQRTYEQSRKLVCFKQKYQVQSGEFEQTINVPSNASGRCQVRAVIVSPDTFAMGNSPVRILKHPTTQADVPARQSNR